MTVDPYSWNVAVDACIDEILHAGCQYADKKSVEALSFLLNSLKMRDDYKDGYNVYGIDDVYNDVNSFNISDFA